MSDSLSSYLHSLHFQSLTVSGGLKTRLFKQAYMNNDLFQSALNWND